MHPSEEEIKIVEKIKFWEEQEKINEIIVKRLMELNRELTILLAENKQDKKRLNDITATLNELSRENENLIKLQKSKRTGLRSSHVSFILSIISIVISITVLLIK